MRADDGAFTEGRGCYTTVRIRAGRPRFAERHARRLQAGAAALGLGPVEPERVARALAELAAAALPDGEGIVRLQLSCDADGELHLVGVPRALGDDPPLWRAIVAPFRHPGELALPGGHKLTNRLALALAGDAARDAGAQEALLLDAAGRLVEGGRSNVLVVDAGGRVSTPPLGRGAVDGIARRLVLERVAEVAERDVPEPELRAAREIVAVNAVRGAVPVVVLDGVAVGDGRRGPWAQRLAAALDADD